MISSEKKGRKNSTIVFFHLVKSKAASHLHCLTVFFSISGKKKNVIERNIELSSISEEQRNLVILEVIKKKICTGRYSQGVWMWPWPTDSWQLCWSRMVK